MGLVACKPIMSEAMVKDKGSSGMELTVLLPAYDEENAIQGVIDELREALSNRPETWEILVVDDGSSDRTAERAEAEGVRVIRRTQNGGAGAARKTGILAARGTLIAMLDADGSYPAKCLPELLGWLPAYDQVNGARVTEEGTHPWLRIPAKWLIRKLAEIVSHRRIPDLNTGMKVFKRDVMLNYLWAIPDGFSCVSSMTLAFLCNGHAVKYVSVPYRKRVGRSKFRPIRDTALYLATVLRIVMYFRPLRIFLPLAGAVGIAALARAVDHVLHSPWGLQDGDLLLLGVALLLLAIGLLADLIVAQRRAR
jgi:polyisoprenyl-phosphate glycosyltransferase